MIKRFVWFFVLIMLFIVPQFAYADDTIETADTSTEVVHVVRSGDTLFRIALRYGVTVNDLVQHNGITNASRIAIGQEIKIPGLEAPDDSAEVVNPLVATAPIQHRVQYGETLGSIASAYGISLDVLMRANGLANPDYIVVGETLQIWTPDLSGMAPTDITTAITPDLPAETTAPQADIALAEPTPTTEPTPEPTITPEPDVTTTAEAISAPESTPEATDVVSAETTAEPEIAATATPEPEPFYHVVRSGEHLSTIAARYSLPWTAIAEVNGITNPNVIYAGQQLLIPGDVSATGSAIIPIVDRSIIDSLEPPAAPIGEGRELVVILRYQMAYAFEDGELVHQALVSTGLPATPTVQGEYKVYRKLESQTMSGPGYYIPGVEWVMYFYAGYAFHAAHWHDNFGQPMSHGCVNMTTEDARFFYDFAEIGTPVHVRF